LRVNDKPAGGGRNEKSAQAAFPVSETFHVGMDLDAPVALDYHESASFQFKGKINKIYIR
jgi:hypothetical protein